MCYIYVLALGINTNYNELSLGGRGSDELRLGGHGSGDGCEQSGDDDGGRRL